MHRLAFSSQLGRQERHSTACTLSMYTLRAVALRSDKRALETKCNRRNSAVKFPAVPLEFRLRLGIIP